MNKLLEDFVNNSEGYQSVYDLYDDSSDEKEDILAAFEKLKSDAEKVIKELKK